VTPTTAHEVAYTASIYLNLCHYARNAGDHVAAELAFYKAMSCLGGYLAEYNEAKRQEAEAAVLQTGQGGTVQ
jgi:hypothetical protein